MSEKTLTQQMQETQRVIEAACENVVRFMEQHDPKWLHARKRRDALIRELLKQQERPDAL